MRQLLLMVPPTLAVMMAATVVHAQQAETGGSAELSTEGHSAQGSSEADAGSAELEPEAGLWELGLFGGLRSISTHHDLFVMEGQNYPIDDPLFEVGLRVAYFPSSFLGVELEGAWAPSAEANGEKLDLWAGRLHAVLQLPGSRVTPFVLAGGGMMASTSDTLQGDTDPALHYGAGVKVAVSRLVSLRLDGRDTVTGEDPYYEKDHGVSHHPEALLGLSLTLGRSEKQAPPPPSDRDGDRYLDSDDQCPDEPGGEPVGCPDRDADKDGILDPDDECPDESGVEPDGCPIKDRDGDGVLDDDDYCPDESGAPPDGCPDRDPDGDRILDPDDECPTEPETKNGYKDSDGCPDELPEEVKKFTGVIAGIEFDVNKATIRRGSFSVLDDAVKVLSDYPELRIRITGHTDSDGKRERNLDLSNRRAESVRDYMVEKGIDADRVEVRGAGPDKPIADNDTRAGKRKNRRIEFKILR
jgi:outer membrane protein OmpA-like peptidoglycan-associated protein/opacity protein-like surface antigen